MQGIILTGGKGSRLQPLTNHTNKHLLDVCGKPMIFHSLSIFVSAGVKDVTLVSNLEHINQFENLLAGEMAGHFETIRFIAQKDKVGIAGSIQMMPEKERRGPYMLVLGDNLLGGSALKYRRRFEEKPDSTLMLLTEVLSPKEFGVAHIEKGNLEGIEEKPKKPNSRWAITGIYFFPEDLFEIAAKVQPSARGEYEVTDILSDYMAQGRLEYQILDCWWVDAGTHESLARAKSLLNGQRNNE